MGVSGLLQSSLMSLLLLLPSLLLLLLLLPLPVCVHSLLQQVHGVGSLSLLQHQDQQQQQQQQQMVPYQWRERPAAIPAAAVQAAATRK